MDLRLEGVGFVLKAAESIPSPEVVLDLEAEAEDSTDVNRAENLDVVLDDKISDNP
jgi:hypothetical protein